MKRVISLCLVFFLLMGCAPVQAEPIESTFFAMDTVMTLRLYQGGGEDLLKQAENRVRELEALLSVTDEGSEIYALDHNGEAELSPETAELLAAALAMCERTSGALDISTYPIVRTWGFTTGEYAVPSAETIASLLPLVDHTQVQLDGFHASLSEGMEIDLGSVAKGYTGDVLSALLKENGVTSATLDLGGNIQTIGAKPDGSPWRIGIQDPEGDGNLGVVEVIDQAVITSGGYERYFEEDGVRYWHILDPETGSPARSGLISVTIIGDSGLTCDGLSTSLFVMGSDNALEHWRQHRDFEAIFVSEDGSVTITAGLEHNFTLSQTDRPLNIAQP